MSHTAFSTPLLTSPLLPNMFVEHLVSSVSYRTVKSYLCAIRSLHTELCRGDPLFATPCSKYVLRSVSVDPRPSASHSCHSKCQSDASLNPSDLVNSMPIPCYSTSRLTSPILFAQKLRHRPRAPSCVQPFPLLPSP